MFFLRRRLSTKADRMGSLRGPGRQCGVVPGEAFWVYFIALGIA